MESCILCLEINKDILDCIKSDSVQWEELNVEKIVEKHFWSLNNIQLSSCICLSCWREVEEFHKFYLRIEEAHLNFAKIKVERLAETLEFKEELIINKATNDFLESIRDQLEFGVLEPEGLIDQTQQEDLTEPEIILDHSTAPDMDVDRDSTISEISDELDKDLKKSNKKKKKRNSKEMFNPEEKSIENCCTEESYVKEESSDLKYTNDVDNDNDKSDAALREEKVCAKTLKNKKRKNLRTSREENDKFIAEHFKQMFCDVCQVPFEDFSAMFKHFTENHKQRGYLVCCKRKFFDRTCLVDHIHCHLNPDYFKCNECGKAMSDRKNYDSHMLRVHRANEVVKEHCCDLCGKSFINAYVLRIHKLTHLPEDEKKFPCADCGKNYGSHYLLHVHRKLVHLKRDGIICYICGKAITTNAELKIHMDKHESIHPPVLNCERLTSDRSLKAHKKSQHPVGGKQVHYCPICPNMSTHNALNMHINRTHKKGYDHKCSICERTFKKSQSLKEHMARHTGIRLYTCPWCPKTFNSGGNMHAHRKKMHPKEWEESKLQKYSGNILPKI